MSLEKPVNGLRYLALPMLLKTIKIPTEQGNLFNRNNTKSYRLWPSNDHREFDFSAKMKENKNVQPRRRKQIKRASEVERARERRGMSRGWKKNTKKKLAIPATIIQSSPLPHSHFFAHTKEKEKSPLEKRNRNQPRICFSLARSSTL